MNNIERRVQVYRDHFHLVIITLYYESKLFLAAQFVLFTNPEIRETKR